MRLYGREAEIQRIDALLESARAGRSGTLVIRGEPGIGKTELIRYAIEHADGMTILRTQALEVEAELAFSGLADILRPVLDRLEAIPQPQAAALASAFGLGSGARGDRFVVCVATLSVVAAAAEQNPLLIAVDDGHWLDEASSEAIFFAARRLEAECVALVFAATDSNPGQAPTGLEECVVHGLDSSGCLAVLSEHGYPSIAAAVSEQLRIGTGGNPLAICEIAAQLSDEQLAGEAELDDPLPAAGPVEGVYVHRVEQLPGPIRGAALVAAASFGVTSTIIEACRLLGIPALALDGAEQAELVHAKGGETTFAHPLLRAAIYNSASERERIRVHAALAEALRLQLADEARDEADSASILERHAWHLAAGAAGPDESIAEVVEEAARTAHTRRAYAAAASGFARAARLTPDREQRARRLFRAAEASLLAGRSEAARELLASALASSPGLSLRGRIQHLRAHVEMSQGRFAAASQLLDDEAAKLGPEDETQSALMLADAALGASTVGEFATAVRLARTAQAYGQRAGGTAALATDMILGGLLVATGDTELGSALVLRHRDSLEGAQPVPAVLQVAPTVLIVLEQYDYARGFLNSLIDSARTLSAPSLLVPALPIRSDLGYRTGDWLASHADAAEGLRLARETNMNVTYGLAYLAQIEAVKGLERECREHVAELLGIAKQLEIGGALTYGHAFLGKLELGLGRIDAALGELAEATRLIERHGMKEPNWVQETPDLIEAYVRAGRRTRRQGA